MDRISYSSKEAEASLCLWESMIEAKVKAEEREDYGDGQGSDLLRAWEDTGALFMRHEALRLGRVVCAVFDLIPTDVRDANPYDWAIVPAILDTFRWSHHGGQHDEPAHIAAVVSAALRAAAQNARQAA